MLFLSKIFNAAHIFVVEGFATIYHVLPASIQWLYRRTVSQNISYYPLQVTTGKTTAYAYLYLHGQLQVRDQKVAPVLFTHGDHGHPFSTLHLANLAEKTTTSPVFSLYIPRAHDRSILEENSQLMNLAIDKMEDLVKKGGGTFTGIRGVGHSIGSIFLAERQFVHQDNRIKGLFAVGGRLNVPKGDKSCDKILKPFVRKIFTAIERNPKRTLVQIVPEQDWNSSRQAMMVRPNLNCHIVPGMHLSGLYKDATSKLFVQYLNTVS